MRARREREQRGEGEGVAAGPADRGHPRNAGELERCRGGWVVMILVEGGPEFGSMFGLSVVKIRPDRVGEFLFRS